jgi:hypothetical protein
MEIQGQEVLSLRDTLCCSTHLSIRWRHRETLRPMRDFLQMHLQEPEYFLVHEWRISERHISSFWDSYVKFLRGDLRAKVVPERTTYCVTWGVPRRVPSSVSASRLCSDSLSWENSLRNPEEQEDHKKGTLSDQHQLTHVTPTALLGSWVLHPIEGMMSLGTDFEKRAKWQGSVEEPAAKDFVARGVRNIKLTEVQGTSWNAIKCKERPRSRPEAVVRQATINLYSQVLKSLGDSFPKLYCVDLAEAYVMQESVSSRIYARRKGMTCDCPTDVCMRNLRQKAERGKNAGTNSCTRFPRASCFEKMHFVHQKYGGACTTWYSENQRYEKTGWEIGFLRSQERCEETSK